MKPSHTDFSTRLSSPMQISKKVFSKYSGAGNSFVILKDFDKMFLPALVTQLCTDHRVDGLILARYSSIADFEMVYFNADGSRAAMCGNGLRCFVHFLRDEGFAQPSYLIEVSGKVLTVKCEGSKILTFLPIPRVLHWEIELLSKTVYVVDSGVPHVVVFANGEVNVLQEGGAMRHHEKFQPEGANVNFVTFREDGKLLGEEKKKEIYSFSNEAWLGEHTLIESTTINPGNLNPGEYIYNISLDFPNHPYKEFNFPRSRKEKFEIIE